MNNNRYVILTGAGASIPWGAPTTVYITDIFRNDNTFINDKGESIGDYIFSMILQSFKEKNICFMPNFETILYFVELMYDYNNLESRSLSSFFNIFAFFDLKNDCLDSLKSFETTNPNFYHDSSENEKEYLDTSFGEKRNVTRSHFYYELYLHFIFLIKQEVDKYENVDYKRDITLNSRYCNFINLLKKNNGIIRQYTLNYDYLPEILSDVKYFDGYNSSTGELDIKKIIEDDQSDCLYHLHGSFRINFVGDKSNDLEFVRVQKSFTQNNLISSNILTGYNKIDRLYNISYFEFYQKLINDCYTADKIFIIGYSFNDMHVNAALKRSLRKGDVDVVFIDKGDQLAFYVNTLSIVPNVNKNYLLVDLIKDPQIHQSTSKALKAIAYLEGFENFLATESFEFLNIK